MTAALPTLATPAGVTAAHQVVWLLTAPVRLLLTLVVLVAALVAYQPRHAARGRYVGRRLAPTPATGYGATVAAAAQEPAGGERL